MTDPYLTAYDAQLRGEIEIVTSTKSARIGPVVVATNPALRGFVTYAPFSGYDEARLDALVTEVHEHLISKGAPEIEWKTRGHDDLPDLPAVLGRHGYLPEDPESIMIGPAAPLAVETPLPAGVTLRTINQRDDLERMEEMCAEAFGQSAPGIVDALVRHLAGDPMMEVWIAEYDGQVVSAGRIEPVEGTDFAGLWGGATRADMRGRGIYRALTAARARTAIRLGKALLQSDSTEYSRPILERSGLRKVTTTTPYVWRRDR